MRKNVYEKMMMTIFKYLRRSFSIFFINIEWKKAKKWRVKKRSHDAHFFQNKIIFLFLSAVEKRGEKC